MTEAAQTRPRLTLVSEVMAADPAASEAEDRAIRKVLDRYTPSIAKRARQSERHGLLLALGAQSIEEASEVAKLKAELSERPTHPELKKHGRHNRWMGGLFGYCAGVVSAAAIILVMQGVIWNTAAHSFREQAMTGAILSAGDQTLPPR